MKRSHIQALTRALRGRTHLVASLHVLSQPTLDEDDHAFLAETAPRLASVDLLRWLARCASDGPRARIIAALASFAARDPRRFEAEILGANLSFLQDEDWAELHERLGAGADLRVASLVLAKTSGSGVYRALLPRAVGPKLALDPAFFPDYFDLDSRELGERVAQAFGGTGPRQALVRLLFPVRHDERACLGLLRGALASPDQQESALWAVAEAGLLNQVGAPLAAWPVQTKFSGEGEPEDAGLRAAALRWLATQAPGEGGMRWLAGQVEAGLARGLATRDLLGELSEAACQLIWNASPSLQAHVAREIAGASARQLEALQRVLPWAVSDDLVMSRDLLPAQGPGPAPHEQLAAAAGERARTTSDGRECASMLSWLEARGVSRRVLFEIASGALRRGVWHLDLLTWLSRRLATRSAWEQQGLGTLAALLSRGSFSELAELFALSWCEASGPVAPRPEADPSAPAAHGTPPHSPEAASPPGFREAAHAAFALALVDHTRAAIAAGDEAAALRALSALACLDPPSRLNSVLHELTRNPQASAAVRELIEVNASLFRRGHGREATLHGLISAIHVLAQS